ncbi:MAG: hypothetical protein EZS28_024236, partial [Streblomastix strix]
MTGLISIHVFKVLVTLLILVSIVNCPETLSKSNTGTCFPNCRAFSSTSVVEGSCQCTRFRHPTGCKCPEDQLGKYTKAQCLSDQTLQKLPFCNESSGISVPLNTCKCIDGYTPVGCNCSNIPDLLSDIPKEICPCLAQGDDIRGGNICPVTRFCGYKDKLNTNCLCSSEFRETGCTCTLDYFPDGCICDTNSEAIFDLETCRATKPCTGGTFANPTPTGCTPINCQSPDQTYKCNCVPGKDPIGCTCPNEGQELSGISPQACPCLSTGDIRAGTTCPVTEDCILGILDPSKRGCFCTANYQPDGCTCTSTYSQAGCVCDLLSTTYDSTTCLATKPCTGGNFTIPTPTGCTPPDCTSTDQTYKCKCKDG